MKKNLRLLLIQIIIPLVYGGFFYLLKSGAEVEPLLATVMLAAGMYAGALILWMDENWLYEYYREQEGQPPTPELSEAPEAPAAPAKKLITRSLLFILSLLPLGVFMMTSTGSTLGVGMLLGLAVFLLVEFLLAKKDLEYFKQRYLYQLNRPATAVDVEWYIRGLGIFAVIFSILVIIF